MIPPGRGGPGGQALPSSLRGAAIIGLAVIVGIVGLQILDDNKGGGSSSTSGGQTSSTSTTQAGPAPHASADVTVKAYNASDVQNAGRSVTDKLKGLGWSTLEPANFGSTRKGTAVQCRTGYEGDAKVLAIYGVGNGAVAEPFPSDPPEGSEQANCIVIVGTT
jgi:LytR cell envelope-related transcriptional attenuator